MEKRGTRYYRDLAKELFLERFDGNPSLPLLYFHSFLCPVTMAEAMVKEYIVENYEALELLVLRLYDAGFHDVKQLSSLSGMQEAIVERALYSETMIYNHINIKDGTITEMGRKTLDENVDGKRENHVVYDTLRRLQIEAATGTVIPGYLEHGPKDAVKSILPDHIDGIVPKESVEQDEELRQEINARLLEYKDKDILNEGDNIQSVEKPQPTQLFYRWAYLAQFEGMKYPMIVMQGYKAIEKMNASSLKKGNYGKRVAVPLSISKTDARYLEKNGIVFPETLVREDCKFEYLLEKTKEFDVHNEEDIDEENDVPTIFEDEKTMELVEDVEDDERGSEQDETNG